MKSLVLITVALAFLATTARAQGVRLYAPNGQYLGNLNSNQYDPNSVANPYGRYGSRYSPDSINNPYSQWGSAYSPNGVRNPYAIGGTPHLGTFGGGDDD